MKNNIKKLHFDESKQYRYLFAFLMRNGIVDRNRNLFFHKCFNGKIFLFALGLKKKEKDMFNIAIVEDDSKSFDELSSLIKQYCDTKHFKYLIQRFDDGFSFLENFHSNYNLIFMDIDMPHVNGLDASKELRTIDNDVVLIFVTNLAKFAIKGYEVDATSFLVKPVNYFMIENCFKKILRRISINNENAIWINADSKSKKILYDDIIYIEVQDHFSLFHTFEGDFQIRRTLSSIENEIGNKSGFSRCSAAYLVNLKYVTNLLSDEVTLNQNVKLPITRTKKKKFDEDFTSYYGERA